MAGGLGNEAFRQAVHIAAALDQHGRAVATVVEIAETVDAAAGRRGRGAARRMPGRSEGGQRLGPPAFADDDALGALGALDDEIAEGIGIDLLAETARRGRHGRRSAKQADAESGHAAAHSKFAILHLFNPRCVPRAMLTFS